MAGNKCPNCGAPLQPDGTCQYCLWPNKSYGKCPNCGAPLKQASKCDHCGWSPGRFNVFDVLGRLKAKGMGPSPPPPSGPKCPNCGSQSGGVKHSDGSMRCAKCGAILVPSPQQQPSGWRGRFQNSFRTPFFSRNNLIILLISIFIFFSPFISIQIQFRILVLGGLIVLSLFTRGHPLVILILIILIVLLVFQTTLGQSALEELGFTSYITDATLGVKYGTCYFTSAFNVNVLSTGNLEQFCQKQVYGFRAEKTGCIECVTFTPRQRTTGIPSRDQIIEVETSLDPTATAAANNISVRVFDTENGVEATSSNDKCTLDKPCQLTIYDDPVISRFKLPLPCKDSLQYKATVAYTYYVEGQSEFKIKQGDFRTTTKSNFDVVNGKSSSGPLSFAIKSDSPEYIVGEDRDVYVNFYLYNEGRGTIKPISTTVAQTPPNKNQELELIACEGSLKATQEGKDKIILEGFDSIPFSGADIVTCHFKLPASIKAPFLTYKFIGVTQYYYSMDKKDTVLIDLINYPCRLTNSRWKIFTQGNPGDWTNPNYNDEGWGLKDLPDSDWSCTNCDKYYRKTIVWNNQTSISLNVSSDDGAACYLNGAVIPEINSLSEARACGHGKRDCFNLFGNCLDPKCQQGWDYTADITSKLQPGKNIIACQVHNIDGPGWFEVQG